MDTSTQETKASGIPFFIFVSSISASSYLALTAQQWLAQTAGWAYQFDLRNAFLFLGQIFVMMVICYRSLFFMMKFEPGRIELGSSREIPFHTKGLFEIFIFMPITLSRLVPMPFTRLIYRALGSKIGRGSYPGNAALFDYPFCEIGDQVIFGQAAIITPHILRDGRYEVQPIKIGNRVTIGPSTVVYGNTEIGDRSLIVANSAVCPGTIIGEGEIWGGNPAKFIKRISVTGETLKPQLVRDEVATADQSFRKSA